MGRLKSFLIVYDKGIFHAGEQVTGTVEIETTHDVTACKILLNIIGEGKVDWSKHDELSSNRRPREKHYKSKEYYIDETIRLKEDDVTHTAMTVGVHKYEFAFTLPETCPSSFEGGLGHVRYWCVAKLIRPSTKDTKVKKRCTVQSLYDLNSEPMLATPELWDTSRVLTSCWSQGKINIALWINKTGFVPGEPVLITGTISNNSNSTIRPLKVKLKRSVDLYGFSHRALSSGSPKAYNITNTVKEESVGERIPPGGTRTLNDQFVLPDVHPSGLKGATYIYIEYMLKISVSPRLQGDIEWEKMIQIGTVPIVQQTPSVSVPVYRSAKPMYTQSAPPADHERRGLEKEHIPEKRTSCYVTAV